MTATTDERLDFELVGFLREQADDVYEAPDAATMARRLVGADRSVRRRLERLVARPVVRVALVGMLLAAVLSATLIAGAVRRGIVTNGPVILTPGLALDPSSGKLTGSP